MADDILESSLFGILGSIIIMGMLIPGIACYGCFYVLVLYTSHSCLSTGELIVCILLLGFFADTIGHFVDSIVMQIKFRKSIVTLFKEKLYQGKYTKGGKESNDFDYFFSLHCLYWNSGFGILGVLIIVLCLRHEMLCHGYNIIIFVMFIVLSIVLIHLGSIVLSDLDYLYKISLKSDLIDKSKGSRKSKGQKR